MNKTLKYMGRRYKTGEKEGLVFLGMMQQSIRHQVGVFQMIGQQF